MAFKHIFKATLNWVFKKQEDPTKRFYSKSHEIAIEGKDILQISAAKAFKGDPSLLNPEDLLLSSLVSCHMMSYLYCCSQQQIEVLSYQDQAEAILETYMDGSGKIVEVNLRPIITISDHSKIDLAISLHEDANKLCFIANSCNFTVTHEPTIHVLEN